MPSDPLSEPYCTQCGAANAPGNRFCGACGANREAEVPDAEPVGVETVSPDKQTIGCVGCLSAFTLFIVILSIGAMGEAKRPGVPAYRSSSTMVNAPLKGGAGRLKLTIFAGPEEVDVTVNGIIHRPDGKKELIKYPPLPITNVFDLGVGSFALLVVRDPSPYSGESPTFSVSLHCNDELVSHSQASDMAGIATAVVRWPDDEP